MNFGRLVLFGCLASVAGCRQLVDNFRVQMDGDAGSSCGSGLPPVPKPATSPGSLDFVIATHTKDWGDRVNGDLPTYPHVGLNVDGVCTTSMATVSCLPPPGAQLGDFTDGPGGIDNTVGHYALTGQGANTISDFLRQLEDSGFAANLLHVRGYNGEANDDQVEVSLLVGTMQPAMNAPATATPLWDGSDTWSTTTAFLDDGKSLDKPKFVDKNAYVNDHTLVARFAYAEVGGPFNDFGSLYGIVVTGKLVEQDGGYALQDGIRAGRWPVAGVIAFAAIVVSGKSGCPISPDDPLFPRYTLAKGKACALVDVRIEGDQPSVPCDALSFGVSMDGVPASIDPNILPIDPSTACSLDSCSASDGGQAVSTAASAPAASPAK